MAGNKLRYCSFCGKSELEIKAMVQGTFVFICNECLGLCVQIVVDQGLVTLDEMLAEGKKAYERPPAEESSVNPANQN